MVGGAMDRPDLWTAEGDGLLPGLAPSGVVVMGELQQVFAEADDEKPLGRALEVRGARIAILLG